MRKTLALIVFLLAAVAPLASAQAIDLTTPITQASVARYRVQNVNESATGPAVGLVLTAHDSSNNVLPPSLWLSFSVPSPAGSPCTSALTISGYAGARSTAVGGEPAGNAAKQNYRIIDWLRVQGCFPPGSMNGS